MSTRRRSLGRGLDSLLPEPVDEVDAPRTPAELPIEQIHRSARQPRRVIREDALEELAQSIRSQGVIEPVIVRPRTVGGYEIVAGERRWRAAQRAGLDKIPVVVRDVDDRQAMAMALIENIQREDLNALEEASALKSLLDEYAMTHEDLAAAVGRSRSQVTNLIRLLGLAVGVQRLIEQGDLEMGHARALLALPAQEQVAAARHVVGRGLSVRQTEALVKRLLSGADSKSTAKDPDTRRLEREVSEHLAAPVTISASKKGRGRLVVRYSSLEELDGILSRMGAKP